MEAVKKELAEYGQEHLLNFWDQLSKDQQDLLLQDIWELNLAEVTSYYKRATHTSAGTSQGLLDDRLSPLPKEKMASATDSTKEQLEEYKNLGMQEVAEGRVAVLLLAGGQGTRLGVTYPKGMYDVGLPSGKSLFQLQAERILRLEELATELYGRHGHITWYILTSEATHEATLNFFRENSYFGLQEENVKAFKQGMLPCFTLDGKIILDEKHRVSKAPDGNGGLYRALKVQGILDDMRKRGIRSVHVHSVDNILVKVADPLFIGYCLHCATGCGTKFIEKTCPSEAVGVICKVDDSYQVVEYSEISKETSELRSEDGRLLYNAGNLCNHYFTVDFLHSIANVHEKEIELHAAKKKIPFIDSEGNRCTPKVPNGIKIEKFVFDVFKFTDNLAVWEAKREEDFSPLKNADSAGDSCPSTARADLLNLHKKWLLDAGAESVINDVEVSPLRSYDGENLEDVKGQSFTGPFVLQKK